MKKEEAIKILREVHDNALFSVRNALETLIPELKENEDERIRKEIIGFIQDLNRDIFKYVDFDSWIAYLEKQKEQKPAEWSEEDKEILNDIIVFISGYADKRVVSRWVEFLKSICHQSKQEVPKDAETTTAKLVNLLKSYRIGEETATTLANRIADTYGVQRYLDGVCDASKQEWSEEDEAHLDSIIESYKELLNDYSANNGVDYIPYNTPVVARTVLNDIKFLKSLRPQPHWKPSEEQIKALDKAVLHYRNNWTGAKVSEQEALTALYDDLKKL